MSTSEQAHKKSKVEADPGDSDGFNFDNRDNNALLVSTDEHEWRSSGPEAKVERKRFFRNGPPESGRVTSLVRYRPSAHFPLHPHPEGEEIFVLEGLFRDWRGDHRAGTFLLNPQGFEHSPSTDEGGNLLFVRLRQYHPAPRLQSAIDTNKMDWDANNRKVLYAEAGHLDTQYLERLSGTPPARVAPGGGLELFVVSGEFDSEHGHHGTHSWLRLRPGVALTPKPIDGECVVLIKASAEKCWRAPIAQN